MDKSDPSIAFFPDHCIFPKSGSTDPYGYVAFWIVDDQEGHTESGHRLSYRMFIGQIPKKMAIMHVCDSNGCINPKHLVLGTATDMGRKRTRHYCGEKNHKAKLTEEIVRIVRSSGMQNTELAAIYGVSRQCIAGIRNFETWKHVKAKPD